MQGPALKKEKAFEFISRPRAGGEEIAPNG